jgi:hypothetical protein
VTHRATRPRAQVVLVVVDVDGSVFRCPICAFFGQGILDVRRGTACREEKGTPFPVSMFSMTAGSCPSPRRLGNLLSYTLDD